MAEAGFFILYRVPYSDCTIGNHVYYARYVDWLERARNEFFRHVGVTFRSLTEQGIMFPVIACHVEYKGAARYDDEVRIEVAVGEAGKIKLAFDYRVVRVAGEKLIATAQTVHVCTDMREKPQRLPEALAKALGRHVATH